MYAVAAGHTLETVPAAVDHSNAKSARHQRIQARSPLGTAALY